MWIPVHSGIIGDEIANEQTTFVINNNETLLSVTKKKKRINETIKIKWLILWNNQITKLN